jgi:clan AA aspartic protease
MGAFSVEFELEGREGQRASLEGLVDTGSTYTWVPRSILDSLGIAPEFVHEFETADGRIVEREVAEARLRLKDRSRTTQVVFGDESDSILLGVVTLEEFSLGVDTVRHELIRVPGLAMGRRALP